jgi:hypothetical protein
MLMKKIILIALIATPLISHAAITIPDSRSYSCFELNQIWSRTTDGIILIGQGSIKSEFHRDRAAAHARGACPGGAESYPTFVLSSDSNGRSSCQFGIACEYGSTK